jgi:hypothetical protein
MSSNARATLKPRDPCPNADGYILRKALGPPRPSPHGKPPTAPSWGW